MTDLTPSCCHAHTEVIRENQRTLSKSLTNIERERVRLGDEEKRLLAEIRRAARSNQLQTCKTLAKDLVRTRSHVQKMVGFESQMRGTEMNLSSMASTQAVAESMRDVTRSMFALNRSMKLPVLRKIVTEFQKQSGDMELNQEVRCLPLVIHTLTLLCAWRCR
jgi:charged multivesicular body protein 2A